MYFRLLVSSLSLLSSIVFADADLAAEVKSYVAGSAYVVNLNRRVDVQEINSRLQNGEYLGGFTYYTSDGTAILVAHSFDATTPLWDTDVATVKIRPARVVVVNKKKLLDNVDFSHLHIKLSDPSGNCLWDMLNPSEEDILALTEIFELSAKEIEWLIQIVRRG